jgi:hypothetical protein
MPATGTQGWLDLTVDHPEALVSFYSEVLGWTPSPVAMSAGDEEWNDHAMLVGDTPVGGICRRHGPNAKMPPVWVPYFVVAQLDDTVAAATERGAQIVDKREKMAVLRDPAGAVFALWQGD